MKCPNCGNQNSPTAKFCEVCGHALPIPTGGGVGRGGGLPQTPELPTPQLNLAFLEDLRTIQWGAIDWKYVVNWAIYNVVALFAFYVALGIVGVIAYRITMSAATSYASNLLSNLLTGSAGALGGGQSSMGSLVALAWLVGLGLIALYGLLVGWAQSVMVRGRFPSANWVRRSVVGSFAAALIVYLSVRIGLISVYELADPLFLFIELGAAFSLVQWLGLRRDVKRGAWIWVLGNVVAGIVMWLFYPLIAGMAGSTAAGGALDLLKGNVSGIVLSLVVPSIIFGGLVAAVTGITMLYVFQKQTA